MEYAENYGTTSVPAKQDEEEDEQQSGQQGSQQQGGDGGAGGAGGTPGQEGKQPKGDAAEAIVLYLNGSRSHPVIISVGDRRHRLVELEEGDVAQHRLKDDRQQMLLSKDGTYISTRDDKVMRIALVPKPQDDSNRTIAAATSQRHRPALRAAAVASRKRKKPMARNRAKDDNKKSEVVYEQAAGDSYNRNGPAHSSQRPSDSTTYMGDRKKSTQVTDTHSHLRTDDFRIFTDIEGLLDDRADPSQKKIRIARNDLMRWWIVNDPPLSHGRR